MNEHRSLAYLIVANVWYAFAMAKPEFGTPGVCVGAAWVGLAIYYMLKERQG